MYLTAMTHRESLFNLTLRWMNNDFYPDDGERISRIFAYESAISAMMLDQMIRFLGRFCDGPLNMERVFQKRELRERIIVHRPKQNPRMEELAENFHANPKYFFPYLPVDAVIITDSTSRLVAVGRIKRLSRIAEKVSFRLVDALYREIRAGAEQLAGQRAAAAGLHLNDFISSPIAMQNDFIMAEAAIARRFMDKRVRIEPDALTVNDIVGLKIIMQPDGIERFPELLGREEGITVVEIEKHQGDYNAVNLLVDIVLPPGKILIARLQELNWEMVRQRGLNPDDIRTNADRYVHQGAKSIRMELILTTPEELMEAEFGRSIHELRILRLRQRQAYWGPLGQNAGYLIEYLLSLASSRTTGIPEIPIRMYGRYLPEEITVLKNGMYGNTGDGSLLDPFSFNHLFSDQKMNGNGEVPR